jgi:hypothetical protein
MRHDCHIIGVLQDDPTALATQNAGKQWAYDKAQ